MPTIPAIPIRPLARLEIERYADHLKKLDSEDRILRFCNATKDEAIDAIVGKIRERMATGSDEIFVHCARDRSVIAAAHVSVGIDRQDRKFAEVGISVLPEGRGKGIAKFLMERVILHAANRGCERLQTMCLINNQSMDRLARSVGMTVKGSFGDEAKHAELPLEAPTFQSVGLETFLNQAALWDESLDRSAEYGEKLLGGLFERMALAIPILREKPDGK